MTESRYVTISVRYEPHVHYGRSLAWIAPELTNAGLTLTEDRAADRMPARTWVGVVDEPTFERFARAWRLSCESEASDLRTRTMGDDAATYVKTLDGMNWEADGVSPIISVSLQVRQMGATKETHAGGRTT